MLRALALVVEGAALMPMTGFAGLTGSRVRERRLALGLRQAEVAAAAGVSASYLNLIEHNRRRVTGPVLLRLAAVLGFDARALAEGAEESLTEDLRAAAALGGGAALAEVDRIDDFVGRFPGWAAVLVEMTRRHAGMARAVQALSDRMAHDPHLSASLHEVLSAVSSVRSTAAILAETEDIAPEWRERFHRNLHDDSERLAAGAEALVAYLDAADSGEAAGIVTPQEELDGWLAARGWQIEETVAGEIAPEIAAEIAGLASGAARAMARDWVVQAAADAQALPRAVLEAVLAAHQTTDASPPDPVRIAAAQGVDVLTVFRRLATLPGGRAGLVICDASGTLVFRKPVEGFQPPRFGAACALWPLYAALGRTMTPLETRVQLAGRGGRRFLTRSFCQTTYPHGFGGPELRQAAMLIWPDPRPVVAPESLITIGSSCRICPQTGCAARRELSILSEAEGA